jgi:O-antigen/teichoic acid export membrane protein
MHQWFWVRHWWCIAIVAIGFVAVAPHVQPVGWPFGSAILTSVVILASLPKAWYLFGVSIAKGYGRFGIEATTLSAMSLASTAGVVVLMLGEAGLAAYIGLFVVVSMAHPVLMHFMRQRPRRDPNCAAVDPALSDRIRPHVYWTALLALSGTFFGSSMSMMFLNHYADAETIGYFSVAVALTRGGVELLSAGLNSVLMPLMAHGFGEGGHRRTAELSAIAMRMFHFCGLLLTGVGVLWAAPLVVTMYGARFGEAAFAFKVLIVLGGITLPLSVLGTLLSTTDKQHTRFAISLVSLAIAAVGAWWFIPSGGLYGALTAYAIASIACYLAHIAATLHNGSLLLPGRAMVRLSLAALAAGALSASLLLVSTGAWMEFAAGCLYLLLFPLFTLPARAWKRNELTFVSQQAYRLGRLGPLVRGIDRWGAAPGTP